MWERALKGEGAMYTILPYTAGSAEEYAPLVEIHNRAWPDELTAWESWRHNDNRWPEGKVRQRFVVSNGGGLVAEGAYMEPHWSNAPGKYYYYYTLLPAFEEEVDLHNLVYGFVMDALATLQPKALSIESREDRIFRRHWLESQGFAARMRFSVSKLDITNYDFSRFAGAQERVTATGVQFTTLAELQEQDPNWQHKLYEMLWEIEQDVPQPDPPVKEPFEEFLKTFRNPHLWPEAWFMAVDPALAPEDPVGAYVGISMLAKNPPMPERIETWLTGVVRSHRRRGIALALKLRAIEFAIQQGGKAIRTDNEENNPMLGINKLLGFQEIPAWVEFEKEL